jgi:hypothetical protein
MIRKENNESYEENDSQETVTVKVLTRATLLSLSMLIALSPVHAINVHIRLLYIGIFFKNSVL